MARWWVDAVEILKAMPRAGRTGSRFGRVFRLRDRGNLEEAFEQSVSLAHDLLASPVETEKPMAVVAAATVDEIAVRLGRPEDAREVLERALALVQREQAETDPKVRKVAVDYFSLLDSYAAKFRERLAILER